jgi:hypothetical protein
MDLSSVASSSEAFRSIAAFICSAQEVSEWLTWFGVLSEASVVIDVNEGAAQMDIKM